MVKRTWSPSEAGSLFCMTLRGEMRFCVMGPLFCILSLLDSIMTLIR